MPSPFPGMDPYLEDRSLWPDVHQRLIVYISETLQPQIRPHVTRIGERIEFVDIRKGYIPDVLIVQPPHALAGSAAHAVATATVNAGVLVADEPLMLGLIDEERRVPYIELIYRETGDIVTVIEVISPANKMGQGREQYIQKQNDLLSTQVNLVEIDLLSEGRSPILARAAGITRPSDWRYIVSISRINQPKRLEVYAFALKDRLPRCRIPLRTADPDVVLDLPAVFARCYDVGGYDLMVDYTQAPSVTLSAAEEEWLHKRLQEQSAPQ